MLGKLLRKERKHQELTQQELADKAGLSTPTVRLLENGKGGLKSWSLALQVLKLRLYGRNLPRQDGIGAQVAEIRKRRGLGQRALAQMVKVSHPTIVNLERHNRGRLSTLDAVLSVLGAGPVLVREGETPQFYAHVGNSSASHLWQTPKALLELLHSVFGVFDLDPCSPSSDKRRAPVKARIHYSIQENGLELPWNGTVFVNPPYGRELPQWTLKARTEFQSGTAKTIVAVVPARTDTKWWHRDVASSATVMFLQGRLSFSDTGQSAPFPSVLVLWGATSEQMLCLKKALPDAWTPLMK